MDILFTCGGTGGHIYPAIALFDEFYRRSGGNKYLFVGSDYGLERDIFGSWSSQNGYILQSEFICSRGIARNLTVGNVKAAFLNFKAFFQALRIFQRFKPCAVIGTGAYPSFHMVLLAMLTGTPYFLIEGNAKPGIVTKLFYKHAKRVFASSEGIKAYLKKSNNFTFCGLPSRVASILKTPSKQSFIKTVLIIGGSCGSEIINSAVLELVNGGTLKYRVVWATGSKDFDRVKNSLKTVSEEMLTVTDYIHDMTEKMAEADLIVARAGAMTVQEIKEFHLPALLVPFARSAGNHQLANAAELKKMGVAEIIEEKDLNGRILGAAIDGLLNCERRIMIDKTYKTAGITNCNGLVYDEIFSCLAKIDT